MTEPPIDNYYAPPTADTAFAPVAGTAIHREGDSVVVPTEGAILPARCVLCNQPAERRLLRRLYWHHPALYLLILAGWCLYLIPALIVRKKAVVEVGVCDQHHRRRLLGIAIGWLGFLVGLVGFTLAIDAVPALGVFFVITMFAAPIVGILMARVVSATRIDDHQAWLKTGRAFLESIR